MQRHRLGREAMRLDGFTHVPVRNAESDTDHEVGRAIVRRFGQGQQAIAVPSCLWQVGLGPVDAPKRPEQLERVWRRRQLLADLVSIFIGA